MLKQSCPRTITPLAPTSHRPGSRLGQVNWTILLWSLGVPVPLVLIIGLMRGCS